MTKQCPKCGKELQDLDSVCIFCGAQLNEAPPAQQPAIEPQQDQQTQQAPPQTETGAEAEQQKSKEEVREAIYPDLSCLRCNTPLKFLKKEKMTSKAVAMLGMFSPSTFVCRYVCPKCGKYEMFNQRVDIAEKKKVFYWGW